MDVVVDAITEAWANVEDEYGNILAQFPSRHNVATIILERLDDEGFLLPQDKETA